MPKHQDVVGNLDVRLRRLLVDRLRWRKLRKVQVEAYAPITAGRHVLICAPTASGKTEAAFIPLFNRILKHQAAPLFCLYLSPLRALLDDCHERLRRWQEPLGIDIAVRHGEKKTSLVGLCQHPPHVLMTTPESLEVILVYRTTDQKQNLLGNLQAIVVDEVHNFVPTHRGTQLSSLLTRLRPYTQMGRPQVIGLSASLGDPEAVMRWLAGDEQVEVLTVLGHRDMRYSVCFAGDREDEQSAAETLLRADKSLVFVPSRATAEKLANRLGKRLRRHGSKLVRVHHSSLDGQIKQQYQDEFRLCQRAVMVATSTLELGIDIGDLDLVVHHHPPQSAESFLQRSGRAGRRTKPANVVVMAHTTAELLVAAAQISLALRGQVEPQQPLRWSYDLLLQQLLCLILEYQTVPRKQAWREVLGRSTAFQAMTEDDYLRLVDEWAKQEIVDIGARGQVSLGRLAERQFGSRNYMGLLSSIPFVREFAVVSSRDMRNIGTVDVRFAMTLEPGSEFLLAGEPWRVEDVRPEEARILVSAGSAEHPPHWASGIGGLSYLVARQCWELITDGLSTQVQEALSPAATQRIRVLGDLVSRVGLARDVIPTAFDAENNRWWFLTFAGHAVNALFRDMARRIIGAYDARMTGFSLSLKCPEDALTVWDALGERVAHMSPSEIGEFVNEARPLTTFGRFLPTAFLRQANAELQYDLQGLRKLLSTSRPVVCQLDKLMPLEAALRV